jgi:hypothetical protein
MPDEFDVGEEFENLSGQQDQGEQLLQEYANALDRARLTTLTVGTAEDAETRRTAADVMGRKVNEVRDGNVWDPADLSRDDVAPIEEFEPQLAQEILGRIEKREAREAAEQARAAEQTRIEALNEEQRAVELAQIQEAADLDRRKRRVEEFLQFEGVEAIDPLSGQVVKVPMVTRKHPLSGVLVMGEDKQQVFGVPEHLEQVTQAYKTWVSLPGHKRSDYLASLPEVMQDALSVVYDVAPPLNLDELPQTKEL